ncbi:MAG TPA: hypothetical protein P5133_10910 [Spirochaetia bacterium]|nr:hypothetical protein [Spirochaetia bacterium]HRZ65429.1 hypothetical protein [Spirochaetia bacterium]
MKDGAIQGQTNEPFPGKAGKPVKRPHIAASIFWTHAKRIGFLRTLFGGFLQYLSVFEFVMLHLTVIVVLYRAMLAPLFDLKRFKVRDYMLFDRGKVNRMRAFDKLNCQFCAYANGTAMMWNDELDELARADFRKGDSLAKIVVALYALCLAVFLFFSFILSKMLFVVIAFFLGMHIVKLGDIRRELKAANYAGAHSPVMRWLVRGAKIYAHSLAGNLEQIESSWCPLKHVETATSVTSAHHANFYDQDRLDEVIEVLARDGTVSTRKPKY